MSDCTAWCNPLIQIARDMMISVPGFFMALLCASVVSPCCVHLILILCFVVLRGLLRIFFLHRRKVRGEGQRRRVRMSRFNSLIEMEAS